MFLQRWNSGFTDARTGNNSGAKTCLRQRHHARRIFFYLLLMLIFAVSISTSLAVRATWFTASTTALL